MTRTLYRMARRQGFERISFHAFDLTPAMLDLFREWLQAEQVSGIQLQQADVLRLDKQLPQEWDHYDLIVSSAMFEYIPTEKLSLALGSLRQRIGKDGRLLTFLTKRSWTPPSITLKLESRPGSPVFSPVYR